MEKREFESLGLLNEFINEDRERYCVYKYNKERGVFIPQNDNIYLLELLDNIGFDINRPGTYLFRELVSEIYGDVVSNSKSLGDYKSMIIFNDLNKERPLIYTVLSDRLGIKEEGFYEYIYDATSNISENSYKKFKNEVLDLDYEYITPGMMAYNIAKYYEKIKTDGVKPPKNKGHILFKKIKKK